MHCVSSPADHRRWCWVCVGHCWWPFNCQCTCKKSLVEQKKVKKHTWGSRHDTSQAPVVNFDNLSSLKILMFLPLLLLLVLVLILVTPFIVQWWWWPFMVVVCHLVVVIAAATVVVAVAHGYNTFSFRL